MVLAAVAVATGACSSSKLDDSRTGKGGTSGLDRSPGTVTFVLATSPSQSYCDEISCTGDWTHFSITTADGQPITQNGPCNAVDCTTCIRTDCPEVSPIACPAPYGETYTGGSTAWDGSYYATSTCGSSNTICGSIKYMPPGQYAAQFCATRGTVTYPDAGLPVCAATAPQECTQVVFQFPSSTPIQLSLPVDLHNL